jgi:hypothetical protein
MPNYGDKPYGLREIKVTNLAGTVQVSLPAVQTLQFKPRVRGGELSGSDSIVAIAGSIEAYEWSLSHGGISLEALAVMTGQAVTTSGTTPNEKKTWNAAAGDVLPYFKIYGKSMGDQAQDDVHAKLYKAKILSMDGTFADGQFYITSCSGTAIDGGSGIIDIVQNETAANLPAS